jgi:predicted N-acyltransferase
MEEIDQATWDALSADRPFSSFRWHAYAEAAMADCTPLYLLLFDKSHTIGRAAFYLVPSEPVPVQPALVRAAFQGILRRRPLLICRTPLAGLSGLVLPAPSLRAPALQAIVHAAQDWARQKSASFTLFDFVEREDTRWPDWPARFRPVEMSEPGTQMELAWPDFETYLDSLGKDGRYHYRRAMRKADELGITIKRHSSPAYLDDALDLIHLVERDHASTPNPWTRAMVENLPLVDGTWLTARIGERLVGCGLVLRDNGAQMATALGLAGDVPYVYFALLYENLKLAFEHNVHLVRLGSGAYDVKRRLGFQVEDNPNAMVLAQSRFIQALTDWLY